MAPLIIHYVKTENMIITMMKMIKMTITSEERYDPPHHPVRHQHEHDHHNDEDDQKITSEELYDPPHHPRAWTFSRMNSTSEHHKLLSLDINHGHDVHDHDHDGHDGDEGVH